MRQLHLHVSNEEAHLLFMEHQYGTALMTEVRQVLHTSRIQLAEDPDFQRAIRPFVKTCQNEVLPCALAGSLASSLYGLQ